MCARGTETVDAGERIVHDDGAVFVAGASSIFGITPLFSSNVSSSPDWCTSADRFSTVKSYNEPLLTGKEDITSTDKFTIHINLWNRWPFPMRAKD